MGKAQGSIHHITWDLRFRYRCIQIHSPSATRLVNELLKSLVRYVKGHLPRIVRKLKKLFAEIEVEF